ncbi:MFS domain-containing protein [Mycena chlorophos]|uniref:MFS domain-containing protein n=1 Tax=Mycena chlorophos TaxID=658473 RepID=A0A8H6W7F4_MYCCL|nr:MFS domain-containing protein [Mycena chlorophos]
MSDENATNEKQLVSEQRPRKRLFMAHSLKVGNRVTDAAQLTLRETLWPLFLVTILYFLWGFAYGLLDTLNKHFQNTLDITRTRSSGLQAAYFGAYPLASLGYGNWVLRNYGFRAVFILGLVLEGIGALLMWPAALHRSFGGFCGATFVIGSGLGCLETGANPYMAITGPPRYAELRINLAQAVQAIGTVIGPVLGSYVFFRTTADDVHSLQTVQWVYLAIGAFVFLLAIVFFFSVIPEVTDQDMAQQSELTHAAEFANAQSFWRQYRLFFAAFAQFTYTGAQVAIASYFINYATETRPNTSSATGASLLAGAQGSFAVGRFTGSLLMTRIKPRWVFLFYILMVVIFTAASITQRDNTGIAMLYLALFFESVCFPTIVAIGIRGIGRHTKRGSGWIVGGVVGGACIPPLTAKVADLHNSTALAMVVPTMFHAVTLGYAACANFWPRLRDVIDKIGEEGESVEVQAAGAQAEKESVEVVEKEKEKEKVPV